MNRRWVPWVASLLLLSGCGSAPATASVPTPAPAARRGPVTSQSWRSPFIPTLVTLSSPGMDYLWPAAKQAALDYTAAHRAEYKQRLAAERGESQAQIEKIRHLIGPDPLADAALIQLYLDGRLMATPKLGTAGGPTVLASLASIAGGDVAPDVNRAELLQETLDELATPGRITQGFKATCESASVQVMIALRDPGEYARLVAGLASPQGQVLLAGGEAIARVTDWNSGSDGWRSDPSRLIQPAFAVYGNAPLAYSNTHDSNTLGESGLTDPQLAKLCSAVFATPFVAMTPGNSTEAQRLAARQAALGAGWQTPVWIDWLTGHVVLAQDEQGGREVLDNTWGGTINSVELVPFRRVLHSVYVPAEFAPTATTP